jgi:hypothetical protein
VKDMEVGRFAIEDFDHAVASFLASVGVKNCPDNLFQEDEQIALFSLFNVASVACFLEHVFPLEGHADWTAAYAAIERGESKFQNMPWLDQVLWLPVELPHTGRVPDDELMIGSCPALQKELALIQQLSPLGLGGKPPTYDWMRQDPIGWFRGNQEALSDEDGIRWIWRALSDGATIAMEKRVAMWCR